MHILRLLSGMMLCRPNFQVWTKRNESSDNLFKIASVSCSVMLASFNLILSLSSNLGGDFQSSEFLFLCVSGDTLAWSSPQAVLPDVCSEQPPAHPQTVRQDMQDSPALTFLTLFSQRSLSSSISCTTSHICTDKTCGKGRRQSIKALKTRMRRSCAEVKDGGYRTSLLPQPWPFRLNGKTSRTVPNRPPSSG